MPSAMNWNKANRISKHCGRNSSKHDRNNPEPQTQFTYVNLDKTHAGGPNPAASRANELRKGGKRADKVLRRFD